MNKIEQVARAIYEAWAKEKKATEYTWENVVEVVASTTNGESPSVHEIYKLAFLEAFAAIEAMRVPTEGMRDRYNDPDIVGYGPDGSDHDKVWEAGIDAALEGK